MKQSPSIRVSDVSSRYLYTQLDVNHTADHFLQILELCVELLDTLHRRFE